MIISAFTPPDSLSGAMIPRTGLSIASVKNNIQHNIILSESARFKNSPFSVVLNQLNPYAFRRIHKEKFRMKKLMPLSFKIVFAICPDILIQICLLAWLFYADPEFAHIGKGQPFAGFHRIRPLGHRISPVYFTATITRSADTSSAPSRIGK